MLDAYVETAMNRRQCEYIDDDGVYYCTIPGLQGVWATGATIDACVDELREVLVDWIQIGIEMGHTIPVIDGLELTAANVN